MRPRIQNSERVTIFTYFENGFSESHQVVSSCCHPEVCVSICPDSCEILPSMEWTPVVKIFSALDLGGFGNDDGLRSLFIRDRYRPFGCRISGIVFLNYADG
jgi:hypothetical protein